MITTVFTNGCFDIVHEGHLYLLREAKKLGDRLIVGLNSDRSVKQLKGSTRPIFGQNFRKAHIEAFSFVDAVIIFNEATPMRLLRMFTPDIFVKGGDYSNPVGFDFVRSYGGEVVIFPATKDSTTDIIKRIKNL